MAPLILPFIRALAAYQKISAGINATEAQLRRTLFADAPVAHCIFAYADDVPGGFALYFFKCSHFPAQPGLYPEDLFVNAGVSRPRPRQSPPLHLARLPNTRGCSRLE